MSDDIDNKKDELKRIQDELRDSGVSRRHFLDRLKALGVGFGAAFVLGVKDADALGTTDAGLSVKSTNPAVDDILADAQPAGASEGDPDDARQHFAQYGRFYRRGYRRFYRRYGRFYRRFYGRYGRFYRRYARFYRRFYRRF